MNKLLLISAVSLMPLSSFAAIINGSADLSSNNAALFQNATGANNLGNTWSVTVSGVTITMTAFSITTPSNATFVKAQVSPFSEGMGVCNAVEKLANNSCSQDPQHRVDNNSAEKDFLLFQFSRPVDVDSVTLVRNSNGDADISYWNALVPGAPITIFNKTLATMNLGSVFTESGGFSSNSNVRTANINNNWSDTFLLAAKFGDTDDYFKVKTLTFSYDNTRPTSDSGIPEPSTYATLGTALIALAYGIRRKSAK